MKGSFDTNNAEKDILPISETKKEAGKTREKVWRRLREREREYGIDRNRRGQRQKQKQDVTWTETETELMHVNKDKTR